MLESKVSLSSGSTLMLQPFTPQANCPPVRGFLPICSTELWRNSHHWEVKETVLISSTLTTIFIL